MNLRDSVLHQGKFAYVIKGALIGGIIGGIIIPIVFFVVWGTIYVLDPTVHSGAPDGPATILGFSYGIIIVVGEFPLNFLAKGFHIWLLPLNLAAWGALFSLIAVFVRPRVKDIYLVILVGFLLLSPFLFKMAELYLRGQSKGQLNDVPLKRAESFWGITFPEGSKVNYAPKGWSGKTPLHIISPIPVAFNDISITEISAPADTDGKLIANIGFPYSKRVRWNEARLNSVMVHLAEPVILNGWACRDRASFLYDGTTWTFFGCHVERQIRNKMSFWDGQIFRKDEQHWQWEGYLTEKDFGRNNECIIFDNALNGARGCNDL